ncbi:MAG TPA: NAD(P)H-dependent oxidoreductase, partial [Rhizomicrobium sp.]|nr:NAD(P)H-dependent oxidoreductase [Rhizomicrobium sp.]
NAIDWVTRTETGEPDATLKAFRGKVAGIMSASPGPWGGMRGLVHLRQILSGLQVLVVAEQLAVPLSHQAFDENGALKNPLHNTIIDTIGKRAAQLGRALKQA